MTVRTVTGRVVKFVHEKGFGFAETLDITGRPTNIFFRIEGARQVAMDHHQLVLRAERDHEANPRAVGRDPVYLIMKVNQTHKGWRALEWGHRPGPNWVHDLLTDKTFDRFTGGQFEQQGGLRQTLEGTTQSVVLTPYRLQIVVTNAVRKLIVEDRSLCSEHDKYPSCYWVHDSRQGYLPDGRLYIDSPHIDGRLTFAGPWLNE